MKKSLLLCFVFLTGCCMLFKKTAGPAFPLYEVEALKIEGVMKSLDSLGNSIATMPFYFLWKDGDYILDIRIGGGFGYFYIQKRADTAWMMNYAMGVMIIVPTTKDITPWALIPFTPRELPLMFSLKPKDFKEMVKEIAKDKGQWKLVTNSGLVMTGDKKGIKKITKKNHTIMVVKRKNNVPVEVIYDKALLVEGAYSTKIVIQEIEYSVPQDVWEINTKTMIRKVDLR